MEQFLLLGAVTDPQKNYWGETIEVQNENSFKNSWITLWQNKCKSISITFKLNLIVGHRKYQSIQFCIWIERN